MLQTYPDSMILYGGKSGYKSYVYYAAGQRFDYAGSPFSYKGQATRV